MSESNGVERVSPFAVARAARIKKRKLEVAAVEAANKRELKTRTVRAKSLKRAHMTDAQRKKYESMKHARDAWVATVRAVKEQGPSHPDYEKVQRWLLKREETKRRNRETAALFEAASAPTKKVARPAKAKAAPSKFITPERFVREWQTAKSLDVFIQRTGVNRGAACERARKFRKAGIPLKDFDAVTGGSQRLRPEHVPALARLARQLVKAK